MLDDQIATFISEPVYNRLSVFSNKNMKRGFENWSNWNFLNICTPLGLNKFVNLSIERVFFYNGYCYKKAIAENINDSGVIVCASVCKIITSLLPSSYNIQNNKARLAITIHFEECFTCTIHFFFPKTEISTITSFRTYFSI